MQIDQVLLGKAAVPFNPSSQLLPVSSSAIVSVPNNTFKCSKGFSKTYILMLQVAVPYKVPIKGNKKTKKDSPQDNINGKDLDIIYLLINFIYIVLNPLLAQRALHSYIANIRICR